MATGSYNIYCKIRDKLGYKDSTVAAGAGVTKSTFSDWKAGRYQPKDEKLQKIASFLGVSVEYLFSAKNGGGIIGIVSFITIGLINLTIYLCYAGFILSWWMIKVTIWLIYKIFYYLFVGLKWVYTKIASKLKKNNDN